MVSQRWRKHDVIREISYSWLLNSQYLPTFHFAEHLNLNSLDSYISILVIATYSKHVRGMTNIKRGGLAFPCRVPVYMWLFMVWLCRHYHPFAASTLHLHKLIVWGPIVTESKFPPFVGCCRFPVLQIRVVSCPGSPISMQWSLSIKRTMLMVPLCWTFELE